VHLRKPSYDRGVTSFLWGVGLGLYLWLGMLAVGVGGATAFILSLLAAGAIFLIVRRYGGREVRRPPQRTRAGSR
jgi:4-amino-4-deoxy-L-arabinose transferase-like glycosyltransferase